MNDKTISDGNDFCPGCRADHVDGHCRECGDSYCDDCLTDLRLHFASRPQLDYEGRVCTACADMVTRDLSARAKAGA